MNLVEVIYATACLLLLSRLSDQVDRSLGRVDGVISLHAGRDVEAAMLLRESFAVNGVLFKLVHFQAGPVVDESQIKCREWCFQRAVPSIGSNLNYLLSESGGQNSASAMGRFLNCYIGEESSAGTFPQG